MALFPVKNSQKGQILLIVILAAVVSLTVGLSAVSRTITNTRVSTEEANSQKALSAAEAGVEELVSNQSVRSIDEKDVSGDASFTARSNEVSSTDIVLNGGNTVYKDDGVDLWLSTHPNFTPPLWSGTLRVLWNDDPDSRNCRQDPAIEIIIISGADRNNPSLIRQAFDPCNARADANGFRGVNRLSDVQRTIGGETFDHGVDLIVNSGYIARVVPIYADTKIGVRGSSPFPSQGILVESVGTSGTTTRKIRVFKGWERVPIEFFPYNLFLP
jgi:hypothetical protein